MKAGHFADEVWNKDWLDARLTDLLREHNVDLALTDTSFMPRPWEMKGALDLVTADFVYVRWLGNRRVWLPKTRSALKMQEFRPPQVAGPWDTRQSFR